MIALAIAALALAAAPMGLVVWLVPKVLSKTEKTADTGIALAATEAELERVKGELTLAVQREAEAHDMADHMAEELRNAKSNPAAAVGAGLPADDVRSRLLRFYDSYKARRGADPVPGRAAALVLEGPRAVADGRPSAPGSGAPG